MVSSLLALIQMQTKCGNSVSLYHQCVKSCAHLSVLEEYIRGKETIVMAFDSGKGASERIGAVVRLSRKNRLFLNKSECHTPRAITTI